MSNSWKKDFKLGGGHLLQNTNEAAKRLKIIEDHEKAQEAHRRDKPKKTKNNGENNFHRNNGKNKKSKFKGKELKNKCRKHPQGNHEWADCYENPNGKNYDPDRKKRNKSNKAESITLVKVQR